jgi:uncharacterized protein YciI
MFVSEKDAMSILRPLLGLSLGAAILMPSAAAAAPAPPPAQPLFAFIYRPGPAWKSDRPMAEQDLRAHGAYFARLTAEGRVVAAGGFAGTDGGMAVLRAADADEAARLLAADPAIATGVFQADLRRWAPRFGADPALVPQAAKAKESP